MSQLVILYHAGDIIIIIWRTFGQPSDSIGPAAAIVNPVSGTPTHSLLIAHFRIYNTDHRETRLLYIELVELPIGVKVGALCIMLCILWE